MAHALPLRIPQPVAMGAATDGYPWPWLVTTWIEGETASDGGAPDAAGLLESSVAETRSCWRTLDEVLGPEA